MKITRRKHPESLDYPKKKCAWCDCKEKKTKSSSREIMFLFFKIFMLCYDVN